MFRREAGKDFVVIGRDGSRKNLPGNTKRACRDLPVLLCDLGPFWRRVRRWGPNDVRPRPRFGTICFKSSICLGSKLNQATPVTFPPERARLVMRPTRTGSHEPSMTIG